MTGGEEKGVGETVSLLLMKNGSKESRSLPWAWWVTPRQRL